MTIVHSAASGSIPAVDEGQGVARLLPCPFCGPDGHPEVRGSIVNEGRYVRCEICCASSARSHSTVKARAAWNAHARTSPAGHEGAAVVSKDGE